MQKHIFLQIEFFENKYPTCDFVEKTYNSSIAEAVLYAQQAMKYDNTNCDYALIFEISREEYCEKRTFAKKLELTNRDRIKVTKNPNF